MRLLLDQNLSQRLVPRLSSCFPGSKHVKDFGLTGDDDECIWRLAREQGFILVSKDSDFLHRALLRGHPPKVVYICGGNCSTRLLVELVTAHVEQIEAFVTDDTESVFVLGSAAK